MSDCTTFESAAQSSSATLASAAQSSCDTDFNNIIITTFVLSAVTHSKYEVRKEGEITK